MCGGSALVLQGLGIRATRDVDILGDWDPIRMEAVAIDRSPPLVERAIRRVAEAHPELEGMGSQWVNRGPQEITRRGLPKGFQTRLSTVRVGDRLVLHLLGRFDLVALKLYASSDDLSPRQRVHLDDLRAFVPTSVEVEHAIEWILSMPDPDQRIRTSLKRVVEELGYEDLAYYI